MYRFQIMNDHHCSERARAYVREYVEQNTKLIQAYLEGSGTLEEVGSKSPKHLSKANLMDKRGTSACL